MTAKHTPGPWSVCEHSWCETSIRAPSTDHALCRLDINHATEESQEADEAQMAANARLIAAAPELLEALKACAAVCAGETMNKRGLVSALEQARAALAKCEGVKP